MKKYIIIISMVLLLFSIATAASMDDYYSAAATVIFESDKSLEGMQSVADVIFNRLMHDMFPDNLHDVIYQKNAFTVTKQTAFEDIKNSFRTGELSKDQINALAAVLNSAKERKLPANVVFFHGDENKRKWGNKIFYKEIGGNAFFKIK